MSKINVLAVLVTDSESIPVRSKSGLVNLIKTSPDLVKFVPITPSPALAYAVPAYNIPVEGTFVAHSPTGRKWSAQISRTESHVFSVR